MHGETGKRHGSLVGAVISLAMGFAFYFILKLIEGEGSFFDYGNIINGITGSFPKQVIWYFMNFTEAQFYASFFAGVGLIAGGFFAWGLEKKGSGKAGFSICYGSSSLFPWVLGSQMLSLALAISVFRYIDIFADPEVTWAATFITVVGAPPAVVLLYGPSLSALLTSSILGGLVCPAMATWFSTYVTGPWDLPGVVANVTTMAITGMFICMVCKAAPWVEKKPVKSYPVADGNGDDVHSPSWMVRRVLADFTEAPFYGNEIAAVFLLVGLVVGEIVSGAHGAYGSGAVPAIVLSQFVGATVGVFLYADKFDNGGWYATYVPVVSVGPACVLMFGASIPVALFAGAVGGIFGGPVAEFFAGKLPEGVHVTVANVTSMAICTIGTVAIMQVLPWF